MLVCQAGRVPVVTRAPLELECRAPLDALALVVYQVCKDQQAEGARQVPMVRLVYQARRARMARMARMASMVRLGLLVRRVRMVRKAPKEIAASLNYKFI